MHSRSIVTEGRPAPESDSATPISSQDQDQLQPVSPRAHLAAAASSAATLDPNEATFCLVGGPWLSRFEEADPHTLAILINNDGPVGNSIFAVSPYTMSPNVMEIISTPLYRYLHEWSAQEFSNSQICPNSCDDEFDWYQPPSTLRQDEDLERIVKWIMMGHSLLRLIHRRLRDAMPQLEKFGIRRLRMAWTPPAFNEPRERGEFEADFWLPLTGPYLRWEEMVQSDTVPIDRTRIHRVMGIITFTEATSTILDLQEVASGIGSSPSVLNLNSIEHEMQQNSRLAREAHHRRRALATPSSPRGNISVEEMDNDFMAIGTRLGKESGPCVFEDRQILHGRYPQSHPRQPAPRKIAFQNATLKDLIHSLEAINLC
ncbi:hypothetical protein BJ508DRAFT_332526 [Ascobolus immersus RN42]|uniref:Uncharacterized protein n=1 Tax=Ascobolus immersus RN42 TaxID=1160509 RepID=A0A3N4HPV5_ASCIM|nr:hypothetical protein BJ508DRAFT_332526 [Ascobolus immersus RN42]